MSSLSGRSWRRTWCLSDRIQLDSLSSMTEDSNCCYSPHVRLQQNTSDNEKTWIGLVAKFHQSPCRNTQEHIYHVRQKNCPVLFLQYLYQTYLYSDNFRHTYTIINLLSPVYFTFFIKSKTGNQLKLKQYSALAHCSHTVLSCFVARCRMSS